MLFLKFIKLIKCTSFTFWLEAVTRICFERICIYVTELESSIGTDVGERIVDDVNFVSSDILGVELPAIS